MGNNWVEPDEGSNKWVMDMLDIKGDQAYEYIGPDEILDEKLKNLWEEAWMAYNQFDKAKRLVNGYLEEDDES
jgi:hypothetical protein